MNKPERRQKEYQPLDTFVVLCDCLHFNTNRHYAQSYGTARNKVILDFDLTVSDIGTEVTTSAKKENFL
jgi:hypothetical protein